MTCGWVGLWGGNSAVDEDGLLLSIELMAMESKQSSLKNDKN